MLTLKKVKELVGAPSHAKRTPSPKMLYEEGIVLLRREFDQGSHLTVYNSGYQKKRKWYWSVQPEEGAMNGSQV